MNTLFIEATRQADKVRTQLGLDIYQPLNIFDTCIHLGVTVRFVDINMEGMYIGNENGNHPTILLSRQRPFPRRFFTCAHELGHHVFKHGTRLDTLSSQAGDLSSDNREERLVNTFAGALLMPIAGIHLELVQRNLNPEQASPQDFYSLSSFFGTGYQTFVLHCRANKIISEGKEKDLTKYSPKKILQSIIGSADNNSHFKIFNNCLELSVIDLETSNYIFLPQTIQINGDHLQKYKDTSYGIGYLAVKPGIIHAIDIEGKGEFFIRIQNKDYIGLAEYRHLENK